MDLPAEAAALLEQGRYADLLAAVPDPQTAPEILAVLRCRADQGYSRAAADLFRGAPPAVRADPVLQLWDAFLDLYRPSDIPLADRIAALEESCHSTEEPLAADLRTRALAFRFVLSGQGAAGRTSLVTAMTAAADRYQQAGQPREALATLRRAAAFAADGLRSDRDTARQLYVRASRQAKQAGKQIQWAHAELALAEFDLRALLDEDAGHGDAQAKLNETLARFDALAAAFTEAGHALGPALVQWAVAQLLLEYGNPQGVALARAAAAAFGEADAPAAELRVWSTLRLWHLTRGEEDESTEAQASAADLAAKIGFALAAEVRVLDQANQAFRAGQIAQARALLTPLAGGRSLQAASRLMLATSANAVGMKAEARSILEDLTAELRAAGANLILGEALAVLATLLMGDDDERVRQLLREAAEVARQAESPVEEAKYRSQLAWTLVVQRMSTRQRPFLTSDATTEFELAERLLAGQRTLAAGAELIRLNQYRGQAAFFDEDWPQTGTALTKAESVARVLGLLPELAFILSYQGLALIQLARRTGPEAYDHAIGRFTEAQELFRRITIAAFVWQTGFYRALGDIEAARWPGTAAESKEQRQDRASRLMDESSALIDRLRESSEDGAAAREQQVWMAFGVDKQTFYREGFSLAWDARKDLGQAWQWLERMKGRALLDGLSDAGTTRRAQSEPPAYEEIRRLLAAEEAAAGRRVLVAEYQCTPQRTMVFGARSDWTEPRQAYISLDHDALRRFVGPVFRQPGGVRMLMEDLGPAGTRQWDRFAPLLAPLAEWTAPGDIVYLVPYGILHDLPLHTLPLDGEPLIERNPVCYAPAAAVLRHTLRGRAPGFAGGSAAVFGDSRGDLPAAREEAVTVAALLDAVPLTGEEVTRMSLLAAFRTQRTVHIAGHGRLSTADGFASGLDLAGDGVLQAGDLLGQPCAARLAVLSGCDTGVSELRPGDEAVGLIRALLLSGVRTVLASQWQVNDASTRDLLGAFHQAARDPAVSAAEALQQAVRDVRRDPARAHLYHWGSFALVGSWR